MTSQQTASGCDVTTKLDCDIHNKNTKVASGHDVTTQIKLIVTSQHVAIVRDVTTKIKVIVTSQQIASYVTMTFTTMTLHLLK